MGEILEILKLNSEAKLPTRAHSDDAGIDLYALNDFTMNSRIPVKIQTGIAMAIPRGFVGMICDRSSMGAKGIRVLGGIVDSGYRGEVLVLLILLSDGVFEIKKGDKIAQMLIMPVSLCKILETKELNDTSRSSGGFGSTGRS